MNPDSSELNRVKKICVAIVAILPVHRGSRATKNIFSQLSHLLLLHVYNLQHSCNYRTETDESMGLEVEGAAVVSWFKKKISQQTEEQTSQDRLSQAGGLNQTFEFVRGCEVQQPGDSYSPPPLPRPPRPPPRSLITAHFMVLAEWIQDSDCINIHDNN